MVGGRPLSFVENLFASYYIPRPVVQPRAIVPRNPGELEDSGKLEVLRERFEMYRSGTSTSALFGGGGGGAGGAVDGIGGNNGGNNKNSALSSFAVPQGQFAGLAGGVVVLDKTQEAFATTKEGEGKPTVVAPNYTQGIKAMAEVEKVGESFE